MTSSESAGRQLIGAIRRGDMGAASALIDAGAPVDGWAAGSSPLRAAAVRGNVPIVRLLLERGANVDKHKAICNAAAEGHAEVVQILIDAGADVELRSVIGLTALMRAASRGQNEAVRALLPVADVNATNNGEYDEVERGWNAATYADAGGHDDIADLLIEAGADPAVRHVHLVTDLHRAAGARDRDAVRSLLASGAGPNAADAWGTGPLHAAAFAGKADHDIVRWLLDAGALPDGPEGTPVPPADFALTQEATDAGVFRLLADAGASMNITYHHFGTRILGHRVAGHGDAECVAIYVEHGGDLEARDEQGRTLLHEATSAMNRETIEALIAAGADTAAEDSRGETPADLSRRAEAELTAESDQPE